MSTYYSIDCVNNDCNTDFHNKDNTLLNLTEIKPNTLAGALTEIKSNTLLDLTEIKSNANNKCHTDFHNNMVDLDYIASHAKIRENYEKRIHNTKIFMRACQNGDVDKALKLINECLIDCEYVNENNLTALLCACKYEYEPILFTTALLDKYYNIAHL